MVTLSKSSTIVPDAGAYELELVKYSDIVQMASYDDPAKMVNKIYLTFAVVNFDFDPEYDETDWNGVEFDVLYTASLHKRANLSPVVAALMNLDSVEDIPDDVELEALKGKRITATIGKTPGGYAKLSGAAPARRKKKSRPAAAPAASVFDADDDDE